MQGIPRLEKREEIFDLVELHQDRDFFGVADSFRLDEPQERRDENKKLVTRPLCEGEETRRRRSEQETRLKSFRSSRDER